MIKKQIFTTGLVLLAFNLTAADMGKKASGTSWHAPQLTEALRAKLQQHVKDKEQGIIKTTLNGAADGFYEPSVIATRTTGDLFKATKESNNVLELFIGSTLTAASGVMGAAATALLSLPAAALGTAAGLTHGIVSGVRSRVGEDQFEQDVAQHLYMWLDAIKQGRLAIKQEILKLQQADQSFSIKKTLQNMLREGKLANYQREVGCTNEQLSFLVEAVDANHDNLQSFFMSLSEQIKIREMNDAKWNKLTTALINWPHKQGFPSLTNDDIKQNLPFAVYFFLVANDNNLNILLTFFKDIENN